jgi:hypothetical protein
VLSSSFKRPVRKKLQELEAGQPYLDALKNNFGFELDEPYEELWPSSEDDPGMS